MKGYFLALLLSLFCVAPAHAKTLVGSIEQHTERLPAPELFLPNRILNPTAQPFAKSDDWYLIPNWLAGSWRSVAVVRTHSYDSRSLLIDQNDVMVPDARQHETFGYQEDRNGGIWTIRVLPSSGVSRDGDKIVIPQTRTYKDDSLVASNADKVILKTVSTTITIDTADRRIKTCEQKEAFRTFVPLPDGLVAVYSDVQTYNEKGLPTIREKFVEFRKRDAEFVRKDLLSERNLYASFAKYLERSGQPNLEPEKKE